jgi:hypothetical protein
LQLIVLSLRELPWWRRFRVPITELGYRLCRIGPLWAYSSVEEVTGRFAPPRMGKTAELANHIIDAPGACVATSTKPDVVDLTIALREKVGPAVIFNPGQLGGPDGCKFGVTRLGCSLTGIGCLGAVVSSRGWMRGWGRLACHAGGRGSSCVASIVGNGLNASVGRRSRPLYRSGYDCLLWPVERRR